MLTQLAKMLVLATFFPSIEPNGIGGTSLFAEMVKTTVDIADLVGIYYIIKQTMGKSELKGNMCILCHSYLHISLKILCALM